MNEGATSPAERRDRPAPSFETRAGGDGLACLTAVLGLLYDGAIVVDGAQRIVFCNAAAERLFGYAQGELAGMPLELLVPPRARPRHTAACREFMRASEPVMMGTRPILHGLRKDGAEIPVSISLCTADAGGAPYAIALVRDAAAISATLGEATTRAETDALTGLGNRLALSHRLREEMEDAHHGLGLLYLDLCGFKPFNDRYGHAVGDRVLQIVAERIRMAIRRKDLATRIGGDEFVVVLPGVSHPGLLEARAGVIADHVCRPFSADGISGAVGISIGGVIASAKGEKEARLVDLADKAMYEAKRRGIRFWMHAPT
jgi:diguanylate cyclase (GGDEF)-like protein/PAS domain S-box-containing protein